jgi:uncharacterized protein (DUF2267 family)
VAGILAAAIAQDLAAQDLPAALQACRAEQDEATRLACYDREIDRQVQPPANGAAAPIIAPAAVPAAEKRFGHNDALAREEREKMPKEERDLEELRSAVANISRRPDGALVVTLENGQVWGQKTPDPDFRLRIGEQARIKRTAMGSYFLYGKSSWSTRVTRLR